MDKPKSYNDWHSSLQGFEGLRHANCCKISYEAGQQSRQAEVDELQEEYAETELYLRGQLNLDLSAMVKSGYLLPQGGKNKRAYTATDKTKQLFGVAL